MSNFYDEVMNFGEAKSIVDKEGWEGFLSYFQNKFPERRLYACSQSWYDDKKYICKIRGTRGDIIIGWYDVHITA